MKYRYMEGAIARSPKHPDVVSGKLPRRQPTIIREAWVPWKYWLSTIVDTWMHQIACRVPLTKDLVFEVYEKRYDPLFFPEEREVIYINWDQTTPENRARFEGVER